MAKPDPNPYIRDRSRATTESVNNYPYSASYDDIAQSFTGKTLDVSFRDIVGNLVADSLTHSLYPYPARLVRHIPEFVFGSEQLAGDIDLVLDPFCGSGTVLLEGQRRGLQCIGFEQNPVAALVSEVKTTSIDSSSALNEISELIQRAKRSRSQNSFPTYLEKWYEPNVHSILARISSEITKVSGANQRFALVCLALLSRKVSIADPRIPVPVRSKTRRPRGFTSSSVWTAFEQTAWICAGKVRKLDPSWPSTAVYCADSRLASTWNLVPKQRSALIFTSPPYGAAQKYIRSTSLEAGWLKMTTANGTSALERESIGREHFTKSEQVQVKAINLPSEVVSDLDRIRQRNPVRAVIYEHYFADMQSVFKQIGSTNQVRKLVMVTGDNTVSNLDIATGHHLRYMAKQAGFSEELSLRDAIRGRTLLTRRNRNATPASHETIHVMKR